MIVLIAVICFKGVGGTIEMKETQTINKMESGSNFFII
jgi:hypothetical protein